MKQLTMYFGVVMGYKILKQLDKDNHVLQVCTDSVEKLNFKHSLKTPITSIFRLPEILAKLSILQVKGKRFLNN